MLNRIVLMGRLVADPELRQTPNGTSVATFRLAVTVIIRQRTLLNVSVILSAALHGGRPENLSPVILQKAV